jgi:hypothetical protein
MVPSAAPLNTTLPLLMKGMLERPRASADLCDGGIAKHDEMVVMAAECALMAERWSYEMPSQIWRAQTTARSRRRTHAHPSM